MKTKKKVEYIDCGPLTAEQREHIANGHSLDCAKTEGRSCYCSRPAPEIQLSAAFKKKLVNLLYLEGTMIKGNAWAEDLAEELCVEIKNRINNLA